MIEYKEYQSKYEEAVVGFLLQTLYHIKSESQDKYFQNISVRREDVRDNVKFLTDSKDKKIFIALHKGEPVGFIGGEVRNNFFPYSEIEKVGYISSAFVLPDWRNKGVLKELEKKLLDFFKDRDLQSVELNLFSMNQLGRTAWDSLGYSTFREIMRKFL